MKRIALLACSGALVLPVPSSALGQTPPCDVGTPAALAFSGLPSRVVIGHEEEFGIVDTFATGARVPGSIGVAMVNTRQRTFFQGTLRAGRRGAHLLFISFDLRDPAAYVFAAFTEVNPDGSSCGRLIAKKIRPRRLLYFPSRCTNHRIRPRRVIIACGDGNLFLTGMRWRGWNRGVVRGRGRAHLNDCIPYCAAGRFHSYPVKIRLDRVRRCRNIERYVYTRLKYRFLRRPIGGVLSASSAPFPCGLYDLF
jgi:hypothetical protein